MLAKLAFWLHSDLDPARGQGAFPPPNFGCPFTKNTGLPLILPPILAPSVVVHYKIHSKLDYCNSLYLNISNQQLDQSASTHSRTVLLVLLQKLQNSITLLLISNHFTGSKLRNAYNTNSFTNLQITSVQQTFLHFWSCSPYNQLVLPAHLQLSLSNALQIPLGNKISDRSFYFQAPALWNALTTPSSLSFSFLSFSSLTDLLLIPQAAENLPWIFIPILLSLSSLYWHWPLGTLIWHLFVIHIFIPYPSSSIRSSAQLVLILCLSYSVSE